MLTIAAAWLVACAPAPTTTPTKPSCRWPRRQTRPRTYLGRDDRDRCRQRDLLRAPDPLDTLASQPAQPIIDGPLIYLSTDPLLAACATATDTTANPPDAQGRACAWPLTSLSANGVFVDWPTSRILDPRPSAGEVIAMNGESARLQTERPGSRAKIGADETISDWVPIGQPTPLSNVWVVACLRGPDLATAQAQLRAMLASAVLRN